MLVTSIKLPGVGLRLVCGLVISSITALLFLSALSSPLPAEKLSPPLGIHDCSGTWAPLPAESKRRTPGGVSDPQPVVSASLMAAQALDLKSGEATACFALPEDPLYQGLNQLSKPPPRHLELTVSHQ